MKLTVLGAGCWGLTIVKLLTGNFDEISVWGRTQDLSDELIKNKRTQTPLNIQLDNKVKITDNIEEAVENAEIILLVVASSGIREVCKQLKTIGLKIISNKNESIFPSKICIHLFYFFFHYFNKM